MKINYKNILVPSRDTANYYVDQNGREYTKKSGKIYYRRDQQGKIPEDYWVNINMLHHIAKERLGYPTQKPLTLLERVIKTSSNEGNIVLDPFCGCGTALVAAHKLDRHWIGIDITHLAVNLTQNRLNDSFGIEAEVIGEKDS